MPTPDFFAIEEQIILLLFIGALVGIAARRLRMPYTVGLVLVGLALAIMGEVQLPITADLILGLLVPPLVFEAAYLAAGSCESSDPEIVFNGIRHRRAFAALPR